ncbi:MAG: prefoldin subunit alpha [Candidatus Woesearchaeota archaeon]
MNKTEPNEEELKQKYMQFKMLQEQLEKLQEHAEMLNQRNSELEITKESLAEIKNTKANTEILAPLADGIFMKTELKENQKLMLNVGADTVVEKDVEEVITLIEEQKKQITIKVIEVEEIMQELQRQSMNIYQELEKHMED